MSGKRSLDQRITTRWEKSRFKSVPHIEHVRAELDRLARQVRKKKRRSNERILASPYMAYLAGLADVLALIKEAKR